MRYLETDTVRVWDDEKSRTPEVAAGHEEEWGPVLQWFAREFDSEPVEPVRGFNTKPISEVCCIYYCHVVCVNDELCPSTFH